MVTPLVIPKQVQSKAHQSNQQLTKCGETFKHHVPHQNNHQQHNKQYDNLSSFKSHQQIQQKSQQKPQPKTPFKTLNVSTKFVFSLPFQVIVRQRVNLKFLL